MYKIETRVKTTHTDDLLSNKRIRSIVQQIQDLTGIPEGHFDTFYKNPISRFLSLTQHCEEQDLTNHLNSVVKALKMRRSFILPLDSDAESINQKKDIWTYTVFVSALMFNASTLISQKVVYQDAGKGKFYKWSPFDGPLSPGNKIKVLGSLSKSRLTSGVYIPLVFCIRCLTWLYRDIDAFETAIDTAVSPTPESKVGNLILKAHGFDLKEKTPSINVNSKSTNPDPTPTAENVPLVIEKEEATEIPQTIEFREWLSNSIARPDLAHCIVETLDGYAFADPAIFVQYCKETGMKDWKNEKRNFFSLSLHTQYNHKVVFGGGKKNNVFIIDDIRKISLANSDNC